MVNLDAKQLRFMSGEEFRVLTAVEMGMKNHEVVPSPLVETLSGLKRGGAYKLLRMLAKNKLVQHTSTPYDGFRLTAKGYDFLALKALAKRSTVSALGIQIGVGKESDIFTIMTPDGIEVCLKLHRLGRTCFRTVKNNRDYIRQDQHASWIYLSRLSALKEYAFMKALHAHGFPTPDPIDVNRHCVIMGLARGYQLNSIQELRHPGIVFDRLMQLIVRLAEHGLIHCDFNEFNLLVDDDEEVTVIDFPQMVSTSHINAKYYFDRDVNCVATFFRRRFGFCAAALPVFEQDTTCGAVDLGSELEASGWTEAHNADFGKLMDTMTDEEARAVAATGGRAPSDGEDDDGEDGEEDEEDDDDDDDDDDGLATIDEGRMAFGNRDAPVHSGQKDAAVAAAARAAEEAVAAAAAAAAARERSELLTEDEGIGLDALGRLAMCNVESLSASEHPAAPLSFVESPFCTKAEFAAYAALPACEKPAALRTACRLRAAAAGEVVPDAQGRPRARRANGADGGGASDPEDDARSVAESLRSTTSTIARARAAGAASARAAEARERVKAELKRGGKGKGTGGSRNEAKDREKRKVMSGMRKELSGASGWS
mmetsp:Transcript_1000/g.2762  ORF Transcript_1000/g.2762 Transcript_1000/m.2762 type:complete len:598 (-) Transcript_1000:423-2216(-)|eukprot:CAMPEP_0115870926 /NCGR_PEP_ID=MMETSP0287-20121206/22593_1 /TAXON_ID=412157 /ORGANISM="Chrysochromulina rotalis, Strain UIO044" /LENGTH=597 /DNA_ID=CAMNT_0003325693 /DNA_START=56 /DNA_END=1849 /DNA_ORIENTATION=-